MNLSAIDLNLLVALDALLRERHVGRAGRSIGLSQPAASHALKRLRILLDDPLLVRVGSRMSLTPRAVALREPIADALHGMQLLLRAETFEPARSTRRFAVMMHDHVAHRLLPVLVRRMQAEAPRARLDVLPWQGATSIEPDGLENIDLIVSCTAHDIPGFERQTLCSDTEVLVVRAGRRIAARGGRMSRQAFVDASHVAVVGRGLSEDSTDTWLRRHGVTRHIALQVPSYVQALQVVSETDLVAFVPRGLADALAERLGLTIFSPPLDPGPYDEYLFFPSRSASDPASIWFRELVIPHE
jgi:DNA-binding transcriptional LysR family regulator